MKNVIERFFAWLDEPGSPFLLAGYVSMAASILALINYFVNGGTP
jgi:hypothetical protein